MRAVVAARSSVAQARRLPESLGVVPVIMTDAESLDRAIHEEVGLSPYDPNWPSAFADECTRLRSLFPLEFLKIEHVGSTAIPGMSAKPIVDILGGVSSMVVADELVAPLLRSGYVTSSTFNATLIDRRWFMSHANGVRTRHLHIVVYGSAEWRSRLHFRDSLRNSADLAIEYSELKRSLIKLHRTNREAYTNAKSSFVLSVSRDA